MPQSATLGLHPIIHVPNYMDLFTTHLLTPDGWMAELAMTDSGRLKHKVVTHPASSLAQDRESLLAETSILTTMLRRQVNYMLMMTICLNTCLIAPNFTTTSYHPKFQ